MGYKFYSESDRGAEKPSWYFDNQIRELRDAIAYGEMQLRNDMVPNHRRAAVKETLDRHKEKLAKIESSRPKLKDKEKDVVAKAYRDASSKIGEAQFTYSDMMTGKADAHREVNRQFDKKISVTEEQAAIIEANPEANIQIVNGCVGRGEMEKLYQLCGKAIGESSNTEDCRPLK